MAIRHLKKLTKCPNCGKEVKQYYRHFYGILYCRKTISACPDCGDYCIKDKTGTKEYVFTNPYKMKYLED